MIAFFRIPLWSFPLLKVYRPERKSNAIVSEKFLKFLTENCFSIAGLPLKAYWCPPNK